MESPKAMQNIKMGIAVSSAPVTWKSPTSHCRWPSWKIQTRAPNVADRLSRFSTSALTGMTTLPVKRKSSTNVASTMMPRAHGSRSRSACWESANTAVDPPTRVPAYGLGTARTARTRSCPPAEKGSTSPCTSSQVPVPPDAAAKRADAGVGAATWAPFANEPAAESTRTTPSTRESPWAYPASSADDAVTAAPGATTCRVARSSKSARRSFDATATGAEAGSTRSSVWENCARKNGRPSTMRNATAPSR
jgi:hypothetical protein